MNSYIRRATRLASNENNGSLLPSKQASMAATDALQDARAQVAPKVPRRLALQPLNSNNMTANAKPTANSTFTGAHEDSPGSDGTEDDIDLLDDDMLDSADSPAVPSAGLGSAGLSSGEDIAMSDEGLLHDDAIMASHENTASFADHEADCNDVFKLSEAIRRQPPSSSNPGALFPQESMSTRLQFERCAHEVAQTPGVLDAEDEDMYEVGMVMEYSEDIFRHLHVMELRLLPSKGYMAHQKQLSWPLRRVLLDWLTKLHFRYNLLPETLFLCVNYLDRFLSLREISINQVQLVGAVALYVAAKFEEINYLSMKEMTQMVENVYTVEEISQTERYMIELLEYNLGFPGPMSFLRRISKADDYDLEVRTLAKYLIELTIMDERFVASPPSWTAAVAHYMARHMLRQGGWTARHVYFSTYTEEQLLPGVAAVRSTLDDPIKHHKAIFEKYSERKYRKSAVFVQTWIAHLNNNPSADFLCRQ